MKILSAAVTVLLVQSSQLVSVLASHDDTFGGITIGHGHEHDLFPNAPQPHAMNRGRCGPGQRLALGEIRDFDKCRNDDDKGAAGVPLGRMAGIDTTSYKSKVGDGEMAIGHNPRSISNKVAQQLPATPLNSKGVSDLLWGFGQFLDHDIDLTEAGGTGEAPIPIPDSSDPFWGVCTDNEMGFSRSHYVEDASSKFRQQTNDITACIDASAVYGSDPARAEALRTGKGGKLKTSDGGRMLPFNEDGLTNAGGTANSMYVAGDIRANEQVGLLAFHTIFVREHNRLADLIVARYPCSTDEEIYQMARKLVGATIQIITYNEFLPALIGNRAPNPDDYSYDSTVDPGIANEFSTAAYRLGHSMLSSEFDLESCKDGHKGTVLLEDMFFKPSFFYNNAHKVDWLLKGFSTNLAQEIDTQIIDDVRNKLFKDMGGCLDLGSLNIQRGRDHGLLRYNELRVKLGLSKITDWDQITTNVDLQNQLKNAYHNDIDEIDAWIGGLAEDHETDVHSMTGELFGTILQEQFTRLIKGDKYFWKWDSAISDTPGLASIWKAKDVTLAKVIEDNTSDGCTDLDNVFFASSSDDRQGSDSKSSHSRKGPSRSGKKNPSAPDQSSDDDKKSDKAFTRGDPHFKTFGGEMYNFHGECDLVLLHNPDFNKGLGMDIHIRTKIEAFWSSVESAVVKLGDDSMEIRADPNMDQWIWFNGQAAPTAEIQNGVWHHHNVVDFLVRYKEQSGNRGKTREANLYLVRGGSKEVLEFKAFKGFLRVDINWQGSTNYNNSVGLLGSHAHDGQRLGRDGKFIQGANAFGQEWQVIPEVDGSLFHSYDGAVVGRKCVMPPTYHEGDEDSMNAVAALKRRLGHSSLTEEAAEKACNHLLDPEEIKACVYDVLATQDLNMASAW